jgi:3-hydroxyethyl bacteriochlorophyllide a dehydrogenase
VIGHGIVGRLTARLIIAMGNPAPTVWEINPARKRWRGGYEVTTAEACKGRTFASVLDASGDPDILDKAIAVLERGGEIILGRLLQRDHELPLHSGLHARGEVPHRR